MAKAYSGSFNIPVSTGNLSITGLGFMPKVVLFFGGTNVAVTGSIGSATMFFGASTGSGNNHCAFSVRDEDNVGTSSSNRMYSTSHCILRLLAATGLVGYSATMVSMDADGFTINVDDASTANSVVGFLALDVENVEVGSYSMSTGIVGSTQDVTLAGAFQPDGLILASAATSGASEVSAADLYATLGFTDGTNQFVATCWSDDSQSAGTYKRSLANNAILFAENDSAVLHKFAFNSFLSDGFRLTVSSVASSAQKVMYIAIKGAEFFAGDFTANLTTADVTSESAACGFTPEALFIMSATRTAYGSSADLSFSVGATTGTEASRAGTNVMMGFAGEDARDPTDSNTTTNLTHCSGQIKTSGGTNGLNHLKSFDTNGFTLYQDQASADAIICPYLAIGEAAAVINTKICISEVWKDVTERKIVVSEVWKTINETNIDISGVWKTV
jgi:hypothetical protein